MLKKLTALLISLISLITPISPISPSDPLPQNTPNTINSQIPPTQTIHLTNLTYTFYLQPLPKSDALYEVNSVAFTLIPNYSARLSSETIVKENKCLLGINGGFYNKQNKPLGLLEIKDKQISTRINNYLFNGYVWKNSDGTLDFGETFDVSETSGVLRSESPDVLFIFQTGPFINIPYPPNSPNLPNQKHSRRMLIAKDSSNHLYFLAIIGQNNPFSGPTLSELKTIFELPKLAKYKITELINLDGGSASSFYGGKEDGTPIVLEEFSPIGAFLCLQNP